jgi:hypothetical protein
MLVQRIPKIDLGSIYTKDIKITYNFMIKIPFNSATYQNFITPYTLRCQINYGSNSDLQFVEK